MKYTKLLWIDLEMTGLDPVEDRILEVAAIVTDWEFDEIDTYEAVQKVDGELMRSRMQVAADFWNANPKAKNALIEANKSGNPSHIVEDELIAFLDAQFPPGEKILLAGNSIHQDRKFIENEWPRLNERLHYRMLDVSAWKVVFEGKFGKKFAKPEAHRALSDIRGSIEELKYYMGKIHA